jgi:uncharacterized membrane protein
MEEVLFILVLVIFFLVLNVKNSITSKFRTLQERIDALSAELKKVERPSALPTQKHVIPEDDIVLGSVKISPPENVKKTQNEETPLVKKEEASKPEGSAMDPQSILRSLRQPARPPVPQAPKPGFFERNPDLEKFIGENLANKIGIGILVLGIGFFVKYAIDQDWINPIGRVFIGILCGGVLLGVAHKMRKTFIAFSSVLVGGGIAVLYLTIAIAFHEYHLFSQAAAFIMTLVITGFAVVLSLGYNRVELAIVAILGGFASPFMVSTGEGNYVVLFTYIFVLDVGMLVLAYYKKWNLVNIVSYVFTVLLFGIWLAGAYTGDALSKVWGAIIFATLFYLVFFAMNIINNLKLRAAFKPLDVSLLLSNTFLYYAAGMAILSNEHGADYKGLFTAALGVFNFIFAYTLQKSGRVDKNLIFLLIGLVLTFISLAAPIQLEGNYITLFWAAEAVLLLWLSQKSGIRLMKLASVIITALMVISLLMDWGQLYHNELKEIYLPIVFNKAYLTSLFAIASIGGTIYLLRNEKTENLEHVKLYRIVLAVVGIIVLYTSQLFELQYQLFEYGFDYATQNIIIGSYNMLFMAILLWTSGKVVLPGNFKNAVGVLGIIGMLSYILFYHTQIILVRNDYLSAVSPPTGFIFHYVLLFVLLALTAMSLKKIRALKDFNKKSYNLYSWFYVFFFVFMASAELDHMVVVSAYSSENSMDHILTQNHKIGYPILWGITSFSLIAIGLKKKIKHLRVISMSLFLVTLLKLFLFDITGISEGGKIAAFISLGMLLLVVSFMYQRLKRFLLASAPVADKNENQSEI